MIHMKSVVMLIGIAAAIAWPAASACAADLPKAAQNIIAAYGSAEEKIMKKAEDELKPLRDKMMADLLALQDSLTKSGDLDGAVAVRDELSAIRAAQALKGKEVLPDPGSLANLQASPGDVMYFKVKGRKTGSVWGTDLYTTDSALAAAAVHAGALKDGQESVIKVTFEPGQQSYQGTARNGVSSAGWGSYALSFRVEAVSR